MTPSTLVVVTGLSGAGKSTALHALEDLGFFCVDNLPIPVVAQTLVACAEGGVHRLALGIDVRVRTFLEAAGDAVDRAGQGNVLTVLFLDASDEALLRRYSTTRRPHPLGASGDGTSERGATAVLDGIRSERERLAGLRARASIVIDTTRLSVHELRKRILAHFGPGAGLQPRMSIRVVSFGFKHGAPVDADLILDVRFLDNPFFVPALSDLPGTDSRVAKFVLESAHSQGFVERALALLEFSIPLYEAEGKSYLSVAIGCTGGRHRSVVLAEHIAQRLRDGLAIAIEVAHRDVDSEAGRPTEPDLIGGGPRGGGGTR